MIRALVLAAAIYAALIAQEFIPPVAFLDGAHVLLVPVLFCYGALWLPFPAMLALALYTGLLSDLSLLHAAGDQVEIGLGWSMLFYVLTGFLLNFLRPVFLEGRWEIHCLSSAAVTLLLLVGQYFMVCFRRESFFIDGTVIWHIAGPAFIALFLSPVVFLLFRFIPDGVPGYRGREGGLNP